jgi:hypothetical protein
MSIAQLRTLRQHGRRPVSVTVIVGATPKSFADGPDKVVVRDVLPDLSPLVGLPVHVIDIQSDERLTRRVIAGLEGLNVEPLGICGPAGSCGVSPDHERAMQLYRETLCRI